MDQKETMGRQREIAIDHIARLVANAAEPGLDGTRLSGEELKKLAEDAGAAISAGMDKLSAGA